ncbi:hypothetical protein [Winogradskyella luteola]|uniref:Lipoprotein n=1 Tax=Winogradskyella luteola TaxID=2828330 RepID=A0A9X1JNT1_9FLAO|nr:hypothetical protein [Winogradskyella luteola]MBV7269950.1 hypothetical protein [Winogradskyella luteola]
MRKVLIILFLAVISCKDTSTNSNITTELNETERIHIELPELNNWNELYSDELVKKRFDENSNNGTTIIGVYLNNETAKRKDSLDHIDFTDYCLFFILDKEQKRKIKNTDLKKIFDIQINKTSVREIEIEDAINKVYSDSTLIAADKPYLLEEYSKIPKTYSAINLIKPFSDDHNYIVVYVYNLINIKNHLVYGGYYLDFNGMESIENARMNNDSIISEFVKANEK